MRDRLGEIEVNEDVVQRRRPVGLPRPADQIGQSVRREPEQGVLRLHPQVAVESAAHQKDEERRPGRVEPAALGQAQLNLGLACLF